MGGKLYFPFPPPPPFFFLLQRAAANFRSGRFNFPTDADEATAQTRRGFHRAKLIFGNASFEELPEHTPIFSSCPAFSRVLAPPTEFHDPSLPSSRLNSPEIGQTINTRVFSLNSKWHRASLYVFYQSSRVARGKISR